MDARHRFLAPTLAVALMLIAVVAACQGAGAPTILSTVGNAIDEPAGPAAAPSAAASSSAEKATGGSGAYSQPGATGAPGAPVDEAKIVRTGSLDLQVGDLASALVKAHDAIVGMGGYVGQSQESNDGDRSTATVSYRVPVDRWDDARTALRGLATKVNGEQQNAIEVTGQLIDLGARIDNLRASEKALQGILEKATKVQDILDVEGRLSDVRGQIEELDAQRAHLADQAALSTLTVTFRLPVVAVVEAQRGWNPGDEVDRASASLLDLLQTGASAGIWFVIVWMPSLLFLGVVLGLFAFAARRLGITRPHFGDPGAAGDAPQLP
jgi:hypothetical protein